MILPGPSDATRPFWDAAAQQRLLLRHCPRCSSWLHPQLVFCGCGEWRLEWREASGEARLLSHTIARRMPVPALQGEVPFTVLLVRTREGPQLVSSLPGDGHALRCGMPMRVAFDPPVDGVALVRFVPAGHPGTGDAPR